MDWNKDLILNRIDELIKKQEEAGSDPIVTSEIYSGAINLVVNIYGQNSPQYRTILVNDELRLNIKRDNALGALKSLKREIELGLVSSIEKTITGGIFGDFIVMAKSAMDDDQKDVASVLASAAIEDALKRLAEIKGINVEAKEMSEVINSLKAEGLLNGAQLRVVQSYTTLRNKAFHAQWDKIDTPEVKSLISFTEEFILKNFS